MNNHFNKRNRNHQRRRQGGVNPNRALDSNGPDVRIRGTAQQIYDKYLALARDASSSGDRVKAENYLQHAEHYFRVLRAVQGPQQAQPFDPASHDADMEGGEQPSIGEPRGGEFRDHRQPPAQPQFEASDAEPDGGTDEQPGEALPNGEDQTGREARGQDGGQPRSGEGEGRRRRRRPRRHREEGGSSGDVADDVPEPAGAG